MQMICFMVKSHKELDPFDGNDDLTLHGEETADVHGPPVPYLPSDDDEDEDYGILS